MISRPPLSAWPGWLALAGGMALAICQYLVFVFAPVEASMGMVQKIFYFHLPLSWWSLASFAVVFVASLCYLKGRAARCDHLAAAAAETGVVLNSLSLLTGCVWARHSWGVWWTWDPRLTTALVLWFLYAGYLMLRRLELPPARRSALCAVLGIVAFLDVPLVFFSARFWRSIHPAVFASKRGGLEPEMLVTVVACVVSFGLLWLSMLVLRMRAAMLHERFEALRQTALEEE